MPSGGHNEVYSEEIAKQVLELLEQGKTILQISKIIGVDHNTVNGWRNRYPQFDHAFIRAREMGFDAQADMLVGITDRIPDAQKARIESDNLKWLLARRAAHVYGDRLEVNVNQTVDISAALAEATKRALPARDQTRIIDTEIAEPVELLAHSKTDNESVPASSTPEIRDAIESSSEEKPN